jgi:hypothetical protein
MIRTILLFLIIPAIGIGLVLLIRRRIFAKSPVAAILASIAVVASALLIAGESIGLAGVLAPAALIASSFIGAISPQPDPWAPSSILRGLAIAAGCIALVSIVQTNYLVAVFALIATGVLVVLFANRAPISQISADPRPHRTAA